MARKTRAAVVTPAVAALAGTLTIRRGGRRVALGREAVETLAGMVAYKADPDRLDPMRLAPPGSLLARVVAHFARTDIPLALPVMATVMHAASWLTQHGAVLEIPGVGPVRPTLWTIALADSASAKTLAAHRIASIFAGPDGAPSVAMLPPAATAAQWILDLAENNGAFWLQDEVGKYLAAVPREQRLAQIEPWLLAAYGHDTISNRIKGEDHKLLVRDPHFTFLGLSVLSTWSHDIDFTSLMDGLCQRFAYSVAVKDANRSMFDHFLFFAEPGVEAREAELAEIWRALCAQPGAASVYRLGDGVLDYLADWWSGLRHAWGEATIPGSYVRRIGFSVLRYLIVLQWLLGKSRRPIDLETAAIATRFAEHHLESAARMLAAYDDPAVSAVAVVSRTRDRLRAEGREATPRAVMRRLSQAQRQQIDQATAAAILEMLGSVRDRDGGVLAPDAATTTPDEAKARAEALMARHDEIERRLATTERKRNERRLREVRRRADRAAAPVAKTGGALAPAPAAPLAPGPGAAAPSATVIAFPGGAESASRARSAP